MKTKKFDTSCYADSLLNRWAVNIAQTRAPWTFCIEQKESNKKNIKFNFWISKINSIISVPRTSEFLSENIQRNISILMKIGKNIPNHAFHKCTTEWEIRDGEQRRCEYEAVSTSSLKAISIKRDWNAFFCCDLSDSVGLFWVHCDPEESSAPRD
jgi:hypothetical protein